MQDEIDSDISQLLNNITKDSSKSNYQFVVDKIKEIYEGKYNTLTDYAKQYNYIKDGYLKEIEKLKQRVNDQISSFNKKM